MREKPAGSDALSAPEPFLHSLISHRQKKEIWRSYARRTRGNAQAQHAPGASYARPYTGIAAPLMIRASGPTRNSTTRAIASGATQRL